MRKWLAYGLAAALIVCLALGQGAVAAPEGAPAGKQEGEKTEPGGKKMGKAKMAEPEKQEEQDTQSKFKTRGLAPAPAARPAKPMTLPSGGQPIRSKDSPGQE